MSEDERPQRPADADDDRRRKLRIAGFSVLGVLGLVFVLQNSDSTEISLLWLNFRMPLFFVLVAMVALGFGLHALLGWHKRRR